MQEVWQGIYSDGRQLNRYPWDCVVSFLYQHLARTGMSFSEAAILELGCGAGNNVWFAAREGARVCGVDFSEAAIDCARRRFRADGLNGQFVRAALPDLSVLDEVKFDCVIDRACLTHCSRDVIQSTLAQVKQGLKPDGLLFSTVYGRNHCSCASGDLRDDGLTENIVEGTLQGVGPVAFYDEPMLRDLYEAGGEWKIVSLINLRREDVTDSDHAVHDEWHVTASPI